jgi:hypothetical protein
MFDVTNDKHQKFAGYGPSAIPSNLDDEVLALVRNLRKAGPEAVTSAVSASSEASRQVLRAFAERMASLAVRQQDREVLVNALIANVVGGLTVNARESLMVMAPIDDAAGRIGADLPGLFETAAECVGHPGSVSLMLWLTRTPENRSLASMGFVAADDADGFRYVLRW